MIITRTFDEGLIYRCVLENWRYVRDDGSPPVSAYYPPMNESIYWLEASESQYETLGVFMAHPLNSVCYEVHICLIKEARGMAMDACRMARDWMFNNTPAERLVANIVPHNHLAIRLAKKAGFTEFGLNKNSRKVDGILYDEVMLGVSRGDV